MNILSCKRIYSILALSALLLPSSVLASSVSIDTNHSEFFVGDTILFSVRVDSEGKNINAIEGKVLLDHAAGAVSLTDINISGSQFSLWPVTPLPSERNTSISFAGGSPGGLTSNDATVFNIILTLQETGQVALSPDSIGVYINDGKGTKDEVRVKDLVITVLPRKSDAEAVDDWRTIISTDTVAPEPFEVYAGQESSVFDGKKFLSFNTTDAQSGVSYYEVTEDGLSPVRSNGTYVLQEQQARVKVRVVAYDSAGNARESAYESPAPPTSYPVVPILIGILVFIVLVIVFKTLRKQRE